MILNFKIFKNFNFIFYFIFIKALVIYKFNLLKNIYELLKMFKKES